MTEQLGPVSSAERIHSIDVVRGFALLGILLMNILAFAMPFPATGNPTVSGGATGMNLAAWAVMYVFIDGKMRGLFSMLFGASALILITRGERQGRGEEIADVYYRRSLWLLLFGMIHAYLIWFGDILYPYALLGLLLFPLRKLSAKALLITAGTLLALLSTGMLADGFHTRELKEKAMLADAAGKQGKKLTDEQKEAQKDWKDKLKQYAPPPEELKKEVNAYRGSYLAALKFRAKMTFQWHSLPIYFPFLWDMLLMMLVGMAFVKLGVLSAERSYLFYVWMAVIGYLVGLPVNSYAAWAIQKSGFEPVTATFLFATYEPGRVAVTLANMSVLLLVTKAGALQWLTSSLAAVGQMAFSNYIFHSLVCTTIFYGHGFRLYNQLERHQLYYIVFAIWLLQLIASPIWLRHFRFGPLEWCWRSLTYWKKQPMRVKQPEPAPLEPAPVEMLLPADTMGAVDDVRPVPPAA